jgi:hypothetical protein
MTKHRISKKTLSKLPAEIAEQIKVLGERYEIKSFTFENVSAGYKLYHSEGSRYTYIYGQRTQAVEMVSENTVGASGVRHEIGAQVALPTGTTVIEVWYFATFGMHVYNAGFLALT